MLKFIGGVAVVCLVAVLMAGGGGDGSAVKRVGYFKSESGNRVMAFEAVDGITDVQARDVLAGAMHTPGRLTFAVIYQSTITQPGHQLTLAPDYLTAASILDTPPFDGWTWGAVIGFSGEVQHEER